MLQFGGGLDLTEKPLATKCRAQVRMQHLDGDIAIVLEVVGAVDGRHATGTEFAVDAVSVMEGGGESGLDVSHMSLKVRPRRHARYARPSSAAAKRASENRPMS